MTHFVLTKEGTLVLLHPSSSSCIIDAHQIHFPGGAIALDLVRRVEILADTNTVVAEAHSWPIQERESFFITRKEARELGFAMKKMERPQLPIEDD